ncbi:MAG: hypothetical protein NT028_05675, partial [candidate division Zixibacteria bacterium]|nr:hypothetical protein [candidate division Zixibacteria bacterium]
IEYNNYVKKLYRKRSKLVHGKTDQVSLEEVGSAQVLSHRLIKAVLENRSAWSKQSDILDHIEQIKFG